MTALPQTPPVTPSDPNVQNGPQNAPQGAGTDAPQVAHDWLTHFPVTFFATVMGLAGLTLATLALRHAYGGPLWPVQMLLWVAIAAFSTLVGIYLTKIVRRRDAFVAEWRHPVRNAFFPAISISVLLLAAALHALGYGVARPLWVIGALMQAGLMLAVISGWIGQRAFQPPHLSPAWFIPAVGNVVAPLGGVPLGFIEPSWLFFSAGILFWIVLLTLVMNRLIFHDPLPARLLPTLVILIAPPAVAFVAYVGLVGGIDPFARILLNAGYVFAALVAIQAPRIARLPFALSWWALSFPLAALSVASFRYGALAPSPAHIWIGTAIWAVLAAIVAGLVLRTAQGILRNEICQPE